jgi:predicted nucleic acid-binding protein
MTFDDLRTGNAVLLDANPLVYHFIAHPLYGPPSTRLVERIEQGDLTGCLSTHSLADVAHRVMTLEAMNRFGWPASSLAARLRKHHTEIPKLNLAQQAVAKVPQLRIQVLPITAALIQTATGLSHQFELLTGDALIVALARLHGLTNLASLDADFDRVPGLTRYAPV